VLEVLLGAPPPPPPPDVPAFEETGGSADGSSVRLGRHARHDRFSTRPRFVG